MDRRVVRTKSSLQRALLELAREHPLEDITIRDVVDRADVNRSSFYQYYADKDELLAAALEEAVERSVTSAGANQSGPADAPSELLAFLQHIADNVELYRHTLGDRGSGAAMASLRVRMTEVIGRLISTRDPASFSGVPDEVVASAFAGLSLGLIQAWIVRDPLPSAETVAEWMTRIVLLSNSRGERTISDI